jgi:hypothetical protein
LKLCAACAACSCCLLPVLVPGCTTTNQTKRTSLLWLLCVASQRGSAPPWNPQPSPLTPQTLNPNPKP